MAIQIGSVAFPALRGGGPRQAQATVVFPRAVLQAAAALTNYAVGFAGGDHHLGQLQIALDPVVSGDAVTVNVTFGLRDWSGDWDDDYTGDIEFAVVADLISPHAPPPRNDVIVAGAEFNQATQFFRSLGHLDAEHAMPDNSVRLIGGKNLGVRACVDYDAVCTTAPIASLSGELHIRASSGANTTIAPLASIVPRAQVAIDPNTLLTSEHFHANRHGAGPRTATQDVGFTTPITTAVAMLSGMNVEYSHHDDHHLGNLQVGVSGAILDPQTVRVTATCGLRDWSGNWDDDYDGTVSFTVVAE